MAFLKEVNVLKMNKRDVLKRSGVGKNRRIEKGAFVKPLRVQFRFLRPLAGRLPYCKVGGSCSRRFYERPVHLCSRSRQATDVYDLTTVSSRKAC